MDDRAEVQIDVGLGMWQTVVNCINDSQVIRLTMEDLKRGHPERRVRCVDMQGRLLDLMY